MAKFHLGSQGVFVKYDVAAELAQLDTDLMVSLEGGTMREIVERLSGELADRYINYIERLTVDVYQQNDLVTFICDFALRADHEIQVVTIHADTHAAVDPTHLELVAAVVFTKLESLIDEAIAESGRAHN